MQQKLSYKMFFKLKKCHLKFRNSHTVLYSLNSIQCEYVRSLNSIQNNLCENLNKEQNMESIKMNSLVFIRCLIPFFYDSC